MLLSAVQKATLLELFRIGKWLVLFFLQNRLFFNRDEWSYAFLFYWVLALSPLSQRDEENEKTYAQEFVFDTSILLSAALRSSKSEYEIQTFHL
ncbi:hypothetical protein DFO77_11790 [Marinilabilia salmonicolor]|jgi:hypothetical protein|uniref:Uncharacterized protein n=1 Tax=Marinilabilia salmonicolor TaxID=989 RepID=A0A2T0XRX8_9BACT|nr:hypothetical protein BY457_102110 [Marinilabilia salmonicolor]RCW31644.1 hypothetical protein DFO77_11790 [Marinilabilia salmonicolor]